MLGFFSSTIQGLGLYVARDFKKDSMVIEYVGERITTEQCNIKENEYKKANIRHIYMFTLDADCVIDATHSNGLARYINHSCNSNCVTKIVEVEGELRIIIFAKRNIKHREEVSFSGHIIEFILYFKVS